ELVWALSGFHKPEVTTASAYKWQPEFRLPDVTGPSSEVGNGSTLSPWQFGQIIHSADGKATVFDNTALTRRTFDSNGKLVEAVASGKAEKYTYDANGELTKIETGTDFHADVHTSDGGVKPLRLHENQYYVREKIDGHWVSYALNEFGKIRKLSETSEPQWVDPQGGVVEKNKRGDYYLARLTSETEVRETDGTLIRQSIDADNQKDILTKRLDMLDQTSIKSLRAYLSICENLIRVKPDPDKQIPYGAPIDLANKEMIGSLHKQLNRIVAESSQKNCSIEERTSFAKESLAKMQRSLVKEQGSTLMDKLEIDVDLFLTGRHSSRTGTLVDPSFDITDPYGINPHRRVFVSHNPKDRFSTHPEVDTIVYTNGAVEHNRADLSYERNKLIALSKNAFSIPENKQIHTSIEKFELAAKEHLLDSNQQALLLKQINRLLEADRSSVMSETDRIKLAHQMLSNPVSPPTGFLQAIRLSKSDLADYYIEPEIVTKKVVDFAITGKHVSPDGTVTDLSKVLSIDSAIPAKDTSLEAPTERPLPDGSRVVEYPSGRIEYKEANHDHELSRLLTLEREAIPNNRRLQRFEDFRLQFAHHAQARGLSRDSVALVYKQLNRLLGEESKVGLGTYDCVDLAE
ncbi:MAG: hypothetical protein K2X29_09420, partial [Candidatus Obscuribacterales bacterium]|nr:hypothetical protein [Candidatus Obscuribacterales bacterium]